MSEEQDFSDDEDLQLAYALSLSTLSQNDHANTQNCNKISEEEAVEKPRPDETNINTQDSVIEKQNINDAKLPTNVDIQQNSPNPGNSEDSRGEKIVAVLTEDNVFDSTFEQLPNVARKRAASMMLDATSRFQTKQRAVIKDDETDDLDATVEDLTLHNPIGKRDFVAEMEDIFEEVQIPSGPKMPPAVVVKRPTITYPKELDTRHALAVEKDELWDQLKSKRKRPRLKPEQIDAFRRARRFIFSVLSKNSVTTEDQLTNDSKFSALQLQQIIKKLKLPIKDEEILHMMNFWNIPCPHHPEDTDPPVCESCFNTWLDAKDAAEVEKNRKKPTRLRRKQPGAPRTNIEDSDEKVDLTNIHCSWNQFMRIFDQCQLKAAKDGSKVW